LAAAAFSLLIFPFAAALVRGAPKVARLKLAY
jgi:hypothetical protein